MKGVGSIRLRRYRLRFAMPSAYWFALPANKTSYKPLIERTAVQLPISTAFPD
jgi:hypothetical protein